MKICNRFSTVISLFSLTTLLGCATAPSQSESVAQADNPKLASQVRSVIFKDPSLQSDDINVGIVNGTVYLSGYVNAADDIAKVDEAAYKVEGVSSVKNDIMVR